ncbi:PREDICTED: E3 ubiquitin-protein ligase RNF139-like [Nicrophorus vespilloides]|uniref:E3 ubiquitin-protein ligase RNF139-like n=1 Tax=Nicrophorus vespilloides TaxID=110193 RepID=A0ABM1NBI9_NICVS|nr:PREDICTED: E3 ubiquitin-protein ligase RNF139-like [Nicrophorus vespilloides]
MFLMMSGLYTFMCQFFFFTLCDIALLKQEISKPKSGKIVSGLTTLLLYLIFTYFATKIRDTYQTSTGRLTRHGSLFNFMKVVLEFAKAAIVVLCMREQGFEYHFDVLYSSVTFTYYLCTEKLYVDTFVAITRLLNYVRFDSLEHLIVPIILHVIGIALNVAVISYILCLRKYLGFVFVSAYLTIYLSTKNLIWNYVQPLQLERKTFASFRIADEKDINKWDDICAVCLERMSKARITPCSHLFHPHCLKRCLQSSMTCPLCKKDFL